MPGALGDREVIVLVGIRLLHSGQVREITIERSSGDRGFDDAAIRALRQALPLPPFPALVKEDSMNLILKFTNRGIGG
jgi:TonB family protein